MCDLLEGPPTPVRSCDNLTARMPMNPWCLTSTVSSNTAPPIGLPTSLRYTAMSAKKGEIIFRRPKLGYEEHDPENWDDYTVCDAYNRAVNVGDSCKTVMLKKYQEHNENEPKYNKRVAEKSVERPGSTGNSPNNTNFVLSKSVSEAFKHQSSQNSSGSTKRDIQSWKVGDKCVALYCEDGLYYDCEIISIDKKSSTCIVMYAGYGNRESVDLADLCNRDEWKQKDESIRNKTTTPATSSYTSTSSLSSTEGTSSDIRQGIYKVRASKMKKSEESKHGRHSLDNLHSMAPPSFSVNPLFTMPPPMFMPQGFTAQPFPRGNTPEMRSRLKDLTDDALSSMLMSWYMAGYHTGYYQGTTSRNTTRKNKR